MATHKSPGLQTNMDVDYVISYRFTGSDKAKATAQFEKLVHELASVGLATEVRDGVNHSVLIFVKVASEKHLFGEVYRSRVKDWIHGVRPAAPQKEARAALEEEPLHEAERLRIIYQLITNPEEEGGAGITPKEGEWKSVESIFPLHDHEYNKKWIKKWSTRYMLTTEDLDEIRERLGSKIAFYFAFTQSYFSFLVLPAIFGFTAWFLLGSFSPIYAFLASLWCIVFTEYWKHQEVDLSVRWGSRNVSTIETKRKDFGHEKEVKDPVTGEMVRIFPSTKRLQRQLLQLPFALTSASVLGALIATCFSIEVFISEVYDGPLKSYLVFLPTIILTVCMPVLTGVLNSLANRLTEFENYETKGGYERALTQKLFIVNFITSYLPILLTAFVYVPFGSLIVPHLDVFGLTVQPFAENEKQLKTPDTPAQFTINPDRLRKQVIYFTVTAQVVNLCVEIIVPYLKRKGFAKVKKMQSARAVRSGGAVPDVSENDPPEEASFLHRVRQEAELDTYDVTNDLREMVLQFGYLSLFSVVWPLAPVSFLINDWVELRADALKICVEMQRPIPSRADTIGPWLDSLSFLTWFGSITTAAIVYLFSNGGLGPGGKPQDIQTWALLLTIFLYEHTFLVVRWAVRLALSKLESPGKQKEKRERYIIRKRYFDENLSEIHRLPPMSDAKTIVDRESLEEDARESSLGSSRQEDRFWARQKGPNETIQIGSRLIERAIDAVAREGKKSQ
ncbi:DUF590-domain-containing protein [Patellaria atrata CBS 101060]|uniref:DUF590-domain-containing protein n=1 Tax=Patellaria atrata CBS 101060 TaxID=1346257 RepID=A0A9P4S4C3_9PEZI|nr:DUF590-domain-containing protein [Patellaria atrata CBS 101060]